MPAPYCSAISFIVIQLTFEARVHCSKLYVYMDPI